MCVKYERFWRVALATKCTCSTCFELCVGQKAAFRPTHTTQIDRLAYKLARTTSGPPNKCCWRRPLSLDGANWPPARPAELIRLVAAAQWNGIDKRKNAINSQWQHANRARQTNAGQHFDVCLWASRAQVASWRARAAKSRRPKRPARARRTTPLPAGGRRARAPQTKAPAKSQKAK